MSDKFYDESLGLELKIEKHMDFSDDYFVIYLVLDNKLPIDRKINIPDTTYVNSNREQLEQYHWESGYIKSQDILKPNSFKKAGLLYEKDKLKSITDNDIIYVTIELPDEGKLIKVSFKKNAGKWFVIDFEIKDFKLKLTPKQIENQILKKIERFDVFEDNFEISFENISIKYKDYNNSFILFFEVHSKIGVKLKDSVTIECVVYDVDGSIIERTSSGIYIDEFYGFVLKDFNFHEENIADNVGLIRLYPKKY
jgi:hypothetical protein